MDDWIYQTLTAHAEGLRAFHGLDRFLHALGKGDTLGYLCFLLIAAGWLLGRGRWIKTGWAAILTLAASGVAVQTLKHLFGRARPQLELGAWHFMGPNLRANHFESFPSGHAFSSFAVAAFLAHHFPRLRWPLYLAAGTIALIGRVVFRHHFLTDVIIGALIGWLLGHFCARWSDRWIHNEPAQPQPVHAPTPALEPDRRGFWVVLAVAAAILCTGLSTSALWDRDETEYAQALIEMRQNNEWLIPTLEGQTFVEKPILMYWIVQPFHRLLGFSEWSSRLPSALFGVLTCAAAYALGNVLWGSPAGFYGALILATSLLFAGGFRLLMTDPFFVCFTTVSLLCYTLSRKEMTRSSTWLSLSYLSTGLAFLTKGPVAGFAPLVFLMFEWLEDRPALARFLSRNVLRHALHGLLSVAVAAPWFFYSFMRERSATGSFLLYDNLLRFLQGSEGHQHGLLYYLPVLALGLLPWTFFVFPMIAREWNSRRDRMDSGTMLLSLWALFLFVFFSASAHKLPHYMLPALPAFALLLGRFWADQIHRRTQTLQWPFIAAIVIAVLLSLAPGVLFIVRPQYASFRLSVPFIIFTLTLMFARYLADKDEWQMSFVILCLSSMLLFFNVSNIALPWVERFRVMKPIGLALREHAAPDAKVIGYHVSEPSLFIYGGRLFPKIEEPSLDPILKSAEPVYVITAEKRLKETTIQTPYRVIVRREGFAENGGETTLVLLTNRLK